MTRRRSTRAPLPVPEIVTLLEELLEQAKAGEIRGFAYITDNRRGNVGTGWERGPGNVASLVTGAELLKFRMLMPSVIKSGDLDLDEGTDAGPSADTRPPLEQRGPHMRTRCAQPGCLAVGECTELVTAVGSSDRYHAPPGWTFTVVDYVNIYRWCPEHSHG